MPRYELINPEEAETTEMGFIVWIYGDRSGGANARITSNLAGNPRDDQPDAIPVPEALAMAERLHHEAILEPDDPILIVLEAGAVGWDPAWGRLTGEPEPVNNQSVNQMNLFDRKDQQ